MMVMILRGNITTTKLPRVPDIKISNIFKMQSLLGQCEHTRVLKTTVSSKKYLTMECVDINCPGRVHAYVPAYDTTWLVSDYVQHTCKLHNVPKDHLNLSSTLLARLLYTDLVECKALTVPSIQKKVK